jgi:tight adherence protein B
MTTTLLLSLGGLIVILVILSLAFIRRPSRALSQVNRYVGPAPIPAAGLSARRPFGDLLAGIAALARVGQKTILGRTRKPAAGRRPVGGLDYEITRAGLRLRPGEFLLLWAAVAVIVPLAVLILAAILPPLGSPLILLAAVVIGIFAPRIWLRRRVNQRFDAFNKQLPDTIFLIANALRAGNSFSQALELVVEESAGTPNAIEFARVARQTSLGLSLDRAMEDLGNRMRSDDLDLMITAILIQHLTGGNLAEILDMIGLTIRERNRIKAQVLALTASQRLTGQIIGILPLAMFVFLSLASPHYMNPLFNNSFSLFGLPAGLLILGFALLMMGLGFIIIRRIVDIEV